MLSRSKKKLKPPSVGDCVALTVSEFDRGRGDPANIIGVILEITADMKYRVGTRGGEVDHFLERNAFELTNFKGLNRNDIPSKKLSIREIVRTLSVGTGQGFRKCTCKTECSNNRCKCHKEKLKCNSACHPGRTCNNNDD